VVQASEVVNVGDIDPEIVVTPCIYVQRIVGIPASSSRKAA